MSPSDKKDAVLKWLAFSPWARGNVKFDEIFKGLIREYPVLGNQSDWGGELGKILDSLYKTGYVDSWKSDMTYHAPGREPVTKNESRYTTTIEGQIAAYELLPQKSELTEAEFRILEQALPLINSYGKIDWTPEVANELHKSGVIFDDAIKRFLSKNGFIKIEYIPGSGVGVYSTVIFAVMTDSGRMLKEIGSYQKYIEQISAEKIAKANKERIELELLQGQRDLNPIMWKANLSTIESNRLSEITNKLIAVFTGAAAIWYLRDTVRSILLNYFAVVDNTTKTYKLNHCASVILDLATIIVFVLGIISFQSVFQSKPQEETR